jgi:hypothetical protein
MTAPANNPKMITIGDLTIESGEKDAQVHEHEIRIDGEPVARFFHARGQDDLGEVTGIQRASSVAA